MITSIQCYLGGAYLIFDVDARDIKEAPTTGKSQQI